VLALADALEVNTSVTLLILDEVGEHSGVGGSERTGLDVAWALLDPLMARNTRLRRLFIFDARKRLLFFMTGCADECSAVWPYVLSGDDLDNVLAADDVEPLRAEFSAVVEERRQRAAAAHVQVAASADINELVDGSTAVKRRRTNQ
jgi:hypothetical protein